MNHKTLRQAIGHLGCSEEEFFYQAAVWSRCVIPHETGKRWHLYYQKYRILHGKVGKFAKEVLRESESM